MDESWKPSWLGSVLCVPWYGVGQWGGTGSGCGVVVHRGMVGGDGVVLVLLLWWWCRCCGGGGAIVIMVVLWWCW